MSVVLKAEGLRKEYPGVVAVKDVSLELHAGEVLALLGENGAGKSTMSKMICGIERPDAGRLYVNGEKVSFSSAMDAMQHGITMVHQELTMVGEMTIAENIFLNRQPVNAAGMISWKTLYEKTEELLKSFHLNLNPRTLVKHLPVGTQQLLEIIRAINTGAKIIILDEPTSSLAEDQIELMFENVRRLKAQGYAFLYITHKLDEVFALSDRIVVMRDGSYVGSMQTQEATAGKIIGMMVGREITQLFGTEQRERKLSEHFAFAVEGLSGGSMYHDVSFGIRRGEIVGVAGLIGAGRTEMALGIMGAHKRTGRVCLDGRELRIRSTQDAVRSGLGYVSEDRKGLGLFLEFDIARNIAATQLRRFSRRGMLKNDEMQNYARQQVKRFRVATPSLRQTMGHLSGGNQQKCLLAMWMGLDPKVLIVDEPTRGVDVGAKADIYQMLKEHADAGNCVLVVSSELPELLGICDRIVVMHNGTVSGEVGKEDFDENKIMHLATGTRQEASK